MARQRDELGRFAPEPLPTYPTAQLSRCGVCGQWRWDGVCTLHPDAVATYGGAA